MTSFLISMTMIREKDKGTMVTMYRGFSIYAAEDGEWFGNPKNGNYRNKNSWTGEAMSDIKYYIDEHIKTTCAVDESFVKLNFMTGALDIFSIVRRSGNVYYFDNNSNTSKYNYESAIPLDLVDIELMENLYNPLEIELSRLKKEIDVLVSKRSSIQGRIIELYKTHKFADHLRNIHSYVTEKAKNKK